MGKKVVQKTRFVPARPGEQFVEHKRKSKDDIPMHLRNAVWNIYTDEEPYCYLCGGVMLQQDFAAGHVLAEDNNGDVTVDNLRPIHASCNSSVGTKHMDTIRDKYKLSKVEDHIREQRRKKRNRQRRIIELMFVIRTNMTKLETESKFFRQTAMGETIQSIEELDDILRHTS